MTWLRRRFAGASIGVQVAMVLLVSVVIIQVVLYISLRVFDDRDLIHPAETTGRLAAYVHMLDATPSGERDLLIARIRAASPIVQIVAFDPAKGEPEHGPVEPFLQRLVGPSDAAFQGVQRGLPENSREFIVRLKDGTYYLMHAEVMFRRPPFLDPFKVEVLFACLTAALLVVWAGYSIAAPLRTLVRSAEAFSATADTKPLRETGPMEIRRLAHALNVMQSRVIKMVQDRTQFFAAVSHDLRTPITRLRLQAEFVEDALLRERMLRVVAQMDGLVQAVLSYLREGRSGEPAASIDLPSILLTIRDECADIGREITVSGVADWPIKGRAGELHRAISNLVDNAMKYGEHVSLSLAVDASGRSALLTIADDGPGISEDQREHLFKPFMRGDEARTSTDNGGFGLGLSIAKLIIEGHGGSITLGDAVPHGLKIEIRLPSGL